MPGGLRTAGLQSSPGVQWLALLRAHEQTMALHAQRSASVAGGLLSVAVKNGAILAGPAWRPGRFAFGLFLAGVALVSQVAGAPTCQPGDVSAPTTSARVVLVVLPKWPLRALPPTF
jgi:hypothetical protein